MDYVKELSEVELYQSLDNLLNIERRQRAVNVNLSALAASAGAGNKDAVKKVNDIVREIQNEERFEENKSKYKEGVAQVKAPLLTAEQLANLKFGVGDGPDR